MNLYYAHLERVIEVYKKMRDLQGDGCGFNDLNQFLKSSDDSIYVYKCFGCNLPNSRECLEPWVKNILLKNDKLTEMLFKLIDVEEEDLLQQLNDL